MGEQWLPISLVQKSSQNYTLIKFPVLIDFEINQISCQFEIIDSKDSFIPE